MARGLHKTENAGIRLTPEQKRQLARAARRVSAERGEMVAPGTLGRELMMQGVKGILEPDPTPSSTGA